jgi:hypothetical protein
MKNMTLFTILLSSFLMLSCSDQELSLQEDLTTINAKTAIGQDYDYLYGVQMYFLSTEAEIKRLEAQKTKLVAELENGNKEVMEQIENIQIEIGKLNRFNKYLILLKKPKGPGAPPKPRPCLETGNCDPTQKLTSKSLIVLGDGLFVTDVIIKDRTNKVVKMAYQQMEDTYGQPSLQIKSEFNGEGIMYTSFKAEGVGQITIPTPIVRK